VARTLAGITVQRVGRRALLASLKARAATVQRFGAPELGAAVVFDGETARLKPAMFQRSLSNVIAAQHVTWQLGELAVNCVLDVGANVGQYAQMLRRQGYTGRIVSFEPVAELVEELRREAEDDPHWWVYPYALGDENRTASINVVPGTMSSLLPASDFGRGWSGRLRKARPEQIEVRRLEDVYDEVTAGLEQPRVFLKLDTQGFDLAAFRGAGGRVAELLGLQSEVACIPIYDGMPSFVDQLTEYRAAGFEVTGIFQVSREPATMRIIEFDVVMIGSAALRELAAQAGAATTS